MKYSILILFLMINVSIERNGDIIIWNEESRITWSDFDGVPPKDKGLKLAVSSVRIDIVGDIYENEIPDVAIEAHFIKSKSWTITNDLKSLAHEQIHFDIAELYARKIRQQFELLICKKTSDFDFYEKVYFELTKEHSKTQKEFDGNAYSSKEKENQWKLKIAKELEELKEYEYVPKE